MTDDMKSDGHDDSPPAFGSEKECMVRCLPPVLLGPIADELQVTVL